MTLRDRIVATARELFATRGYENTTIADIIETAGASKGGFYHHFSSKGEILEELIKTYITMVKTAYQKILDDTSQNVIEKFIASYYKLGEHKKDAIQDYERIQKTYMFERNQHLLRKMGEAFESATAFFYHELFMQGINEGVFRTEYPEELAHMWSREVIRFHRMSVKIFTGEESSETRFYRTLRFNERLINSQLGLHDGEIALEAMGREYLENMKRFVEAKDGLND